MRNFTTENIEKFMLESNRIEGEDRINPNDLEACKFFFEWKDHGIGNVLFLHKMLGDYLNKDWVGKFRTVNVTVGGHQTPAPEHVERLMEEYMEDFKNMDSWEAHNRFEKIHPFQDLNGRTGRIIWLSKALKEGYDFSIPFLQKYYYQTLSKYEN